MDFWHFWSRGVCEAHPAELPAPVPGRRGWGEVSSEVERDWPGVLGRERPVEQVLAHLGKHPDELGLGGQVLKLPGVRFEVVEGGL